MGMTTDEYRARYRSGAESDDLATSKREQAAAYRDRYGMKPLTEPTEVRPQSFTSGLFDVLTRKAWSPQEVAVDATSAAFEPLSVENDAAKAARQALPKGQRYGQYWKNVGKGVAKRTPYAIAAGSAAGGIGAFQELLHKHYHGHEIEGEWATTDRLKNAMYAAVTDPEFATKFGKGALIGTGAEAGGAAIFSLMKHAGSGATKLFEKGLEIPVVKQAIEWFPFLLDQTKRQWNFSKDPYVGEGILTQQEKNLDKGPAWDIRESDVHNIAEEHNIPGTPSLYRGGQEGQDATELMKVAPQASRWFRKRVEKEQPRAMQGWATDLRDRLNDDPMNPTLQSAARWGFFRGQQPKATTNFGKGPSAYATVVEAGRKTVARTRDKMYEHMKKNTRQFREKVGLNGQTLAKRPPSEAHQFATHKYSKQDIQSVVAAYRASNPAAKGQTSEDIVTFLATKGNEGIKKQIRALKKDELSIQDLVLAHRQTLSALKHVQEFEDGGKLLHAFGVISNTLESVLNQAGRADVYDDFLRANKGWRKFAESFADYRIDKHTRKEVVGSLTDIMMRKPDEAIPAMERAFYSPDVSADDILRIKHVLHQYGGAEGRQLWYTMRGGFMQRHLNRFFQENKVNYKAAAKDFYDLIAVNPKKAQALFGNMLPEMKKHYAMHEKLYEQNINITDVSGLMHAGKRWRNKIRLGVLGAALLLSTHGGALAFGPHAWMIADTASGLVAGTFLGGAALLYSKPSGLLMVNRGLEGFLHSVERQAQGKPMNSTAIKALERLGMAAAKISTIHRGNPIPEVEWAAEQEGAIGPTEQEEVDAWLDEDPAQEDAQVEAFLAE
jgi:hypothetical protein